MSPSFPGAIRRFASLLESLSPVQDAQPVAALVTNVLPLARQYGLSAYDAAHVERAMRRGAGLARAEGRGRDLSGTSQLNPYSWPVPRIKVICS